VPLHLDGGRQGLADLSFLPPPGYRAYQVRAYTGMRSNGLCEPTLKAWFPPAGDDRNVRLWDGGGLGGQSGDQRPRVFLRAPSFMREWPEEPQIATLPLDFDAGRLVRLVRLGDAERAVRLTLESPAHRMRLLRNADTPAELDTLALRVDAEPRVGQVVVCGRKASPVCWAAVYGVLAVGEGAGHRFQARLPYAL